MENPFVNRYDPCAVCETGYTLEKCYNGDPRWIKVTLPNMDSPMLFQKSSLRVICMSDECADACPPTPLRADLPPTYNKAVITGIGMYAAEYGNVSSQLRPLHIELIQETTTIVGQTFTDQSTFCAALNAIIDCDCECE